MQVNVAGSFHEKIGIDGVIVTKLDGDTGAGGAVDRSRNGRPILYVGMGRKTFPIWNSFIETEWLPYSGYERDHPDPD